MALSIGIYDKHGKYIALDSQQTRLKRMQATISAFFADCDSSSLYADKITGRGTYYPILITLTYQSVALWDSKDISRVIDAYRKDWVQRLGKPPGHFRYVWVAERQKRGTIHYHIVLWCPRGKSLAKPDKYHKKGSTKIEGVRKGIRGYLSKYLTKGSTGIQGAFPEPMPKGARLFGHGGMRYAARVDLRYKLLPSYVRDIFKQENGIVRRAKGGWEQGKTFLLSPWEVFKGELNGLHCIIIGWCNIYSLLEDNPRYG